MSNDTIKQIKVTTSKRFGDGLDIKVGGKVVATLTCRDEFNWAIRAGFHSSIVEERTRPSFEAFLRSHDLRDGLIIKDVSGFKYDKRYQMLNGN